MDTLLVVVLLASSVSAAFAKAFVFNVDYKDISPDCVTKRVAVVNGQYPGPTIMCRSGEILTVTVNNRLTEGLTIHWHGLHQKGQDVWQDGNAFGAQCPIPPGGTHTYRFSTAGQWGTFWWHAHIGLLRTSVHGSLIIRAPPTFVEPFPRPSRTYSILVNDWYWKSNSELLQGLDQVNSPYRPFGKPDTLHINGRSRTNCASYNGACRSSGRCLPCNDSPQAVCQQMKTFSVISGFTYRFRLANVGLFGSVNVQFQGHSFKIVEADGNYIKPVTQTAIDILPGETFSVLLTANQSPGNYWVAANGRFDSTGAAPGVAVLRYRGVAWSLPRGPVPSAPVSDPRNTAFSITQQNSFKALRPSNIQGLSVTTRLRLTWGAHRVNGKFLYSVNNVSYVSGNVPVQYADWANSNNAFDTSIMSPHGANLPGYAGTPCKVGTSALDVPLNSVVQIVLQNNAPPGLEHPWHLHGYDFWVVGSGSGKYDPNRESSYNFNLVDPPLRNMVNVHDNQWVAIRFVANNPGMRQIHCHLEPHVHLGMQTYLRIHDSRLPGPPPNYVKSCPGYQPTQIHSTPQPSSHTPTPVTPPHNQNGRPAGGNVDFDWSEIGEVARLNVLVGSTVTFIYGKGDNQDHSLSPLSTSQGVPGVNAACFTATRALLLAISNKDGICMDSSVKDCPNVKPPGFKKVVRFDVEGTYAFTCSMHTGTQNLVLTVTRTPQLNVQPPPVKPPPVQSPPAAKQQQPVPSDGCPAAPSGPRPKASWATQQADNARTGWQSKEYFLNPSNVKGGLFKKLNAKSVDGQVYAQPLVAPNVRLSDGRTTDVVIIATESNNVYGFNADPNGFNQIWSKNLGRPFPAPGGCTDLTPIVGITSTPVADSNTVYVVAKAMEGSTTVFRLHALALANGGTRSSAPIAATYTGPNGQSISFEARIHHQRSALALYGGNVWIAFSSHCDKDNYHGWVIGMSSSSLTVVKQYSSTTNHLGWGAFWMGGQGPTISNGFMYAATGNGRIDGGDMSQAIIKLNLNSGPNMRMADYFRPTYPNSRTYAGDTDLGSGGVVLIQDQPGGEMLAQGGKARILYIVKTGDMKKDCNPCSSEDGHAHQRILLGGASVFSSGAYWPRRAGTESYFYIHNGAGYSGQGLTRFEVRGGRLSATKSCGRASLFHPRGATPAISSDGCRNGIVWETGQGWGNKARLVAWDALTLELIYNSDDHGDGLGHYMKFSTPAIANGFVYVAYDGGIAQYGLR